MKATRYCLVVAIAMFFAHAASGLAQVLAKNFEIDKTQPYVYIKFDHFGDRKPVNDWESTKGLWLRLVNNCRLPISISVLDPGTGDPGGIVNFEVVPNAGYSAPDPEQSKKMPFGYAADIGTLVTIQPKGDFLFSVPAESVTSHWYIQIRFDFALPELKPGNNQPSGNYEPYSVVDFNWYIIPEQYRRSDIAQPSSPGNAGSTTKPVTDTLVHESGHVDPPKQQ